MKLYFITIALLITSFAFSQAYKPMLKESKTWEVLDYSFIPDPPNNIEYSYFIKYFIKGDSSINNLTYHKLRYIKAQTYPLPASPSYYTPVYDTISSLSGVLLREDSIARKIWIRGTSSIDSTEYLMYDFSLTVGDTIHSFFMAQFMVVNGIDIGWHPYEGIIDSIRPILLNNNDTTRAFYITPISFNSFSIPFYIMEGVGSLQGFISPFKYDFENTYHLICVNDSGINLFSTPTYIGNCGYTLGNKEIIQKQSSFNIYPNPTSTQLTIATEIVFNEINIIDITGKTIKTIKENTTALNVVELPLGVYFIKLITADKIITKKFIKQ
jgi:hypothetical protein